MFIMSTSSPTPTIVSATGIISIPTSSQTVAASATTIISIPVSSETELSSGSGVITIPLASGADTSPVVTETQTAAVSIIPITSTSILLSGPTDVLSLPLTTTFNPPTSCSNRYYMSTASVYQPVITSGTLDPMFAQCQYSGTNNSVVYSPGMCPGNMQTNFIQSSKDSFTELCCQSGFTWNPLGCASPVTGNTTVPIFPTTGISTTYAILNNIVASHSPVTIFWASSDISLFPADVASKRSALLTASNATSITGNNPNNSISSNNSDSSGGSTKSNTGIGLTQPARIGTGVGVALGGIIILISISAWLYRVRRSRKQVHVRPRNGAKELDGTQAIWKRFFGREWRSELPLDGPPAELATEPDPLELAVDQAPAELPGSYNYSEPVKVEKNTEGHKGPTS